MPGRHLVRERPAPAVLTAADETQVAATSDVTTQRLGELLRGARRSAGLTSRQPGGRTTPAGLDHPKTDATLKDQDAEQQLQLADESMQTILKLLR